MIRFLFTCNSVFFTIDVACLVLFFGYILQSAEIMGEPIILTSDGGVTKDILRKAKPDAVSPTESLPLVDGKHYQSVYVVI